jgi:asparagine synthase (glutamine-hydrolysing)
MCGIVGFSHLRKRVPPRVLTSALESLSHRGPDCDRSYASKYASLGAARLRIRDLQRGDQPLLSVDRNVVAIFNGEIFNYHEIRSELEREGAVFESNCDTEVVLNAFLHWDTGCFARFRGMFAVALWIESERRLVLARDRMGIKPLYYYLEDDEIYFGSELKCIFAHPDVPRRLSTAALNCYLSLNYVPGPLTLVDGILKVMPGHLLEWRAGNCELRSYLPARPVAEVPTTIEEASCQLGDLLEKAVTEQLVSDVPVGVWLSGGLDSSTILHYATQVCHSPLRTFSVTFRGRSFDESSYVKEVANHYGTIHTELDLNERCDLAGSIERIAYYSDEPSADAGALPVWFLAERTRQDVTVVLGGEGADELFAGYLTYKADVLSEVARRLPTPVRRAALACASLLPVSDDKISFEYKLKRFLQGTLLSPDCAHVFWNGTFSEEEKRRLFLFADEVPMFAVLSTMGQQRGLQRYLDFDQRCYLADDILYKVDRMSMAHSLEVRPPFLDPRIVDFAAGLRSDFKLHGMTTKYVLRELMRGKLPRTVLRRPKIGFDIPIHDWFRGTLRNLLLDTLSKENVTRTQLFRWSAIERLLREHLNRKANYGYHLWGLLVLLLWMREWNIQAPAEAGSYVFEPSQEVPLLQ